jgi:hypothetical protein
MMLTTTMVHVRMDALGPLRVNAELGSPSHCVHPQSAMPISALSPHLAADRESHLCTGEAAADLLEERLRRS